MEEEEGGKGDEDGGCAVSDLRGQEGVAQAVEGYADICRGKHECLTA